MAADASSFQISVQSLKVPQEFSDYDKIEDSDTIIRLEEWREQAVVHLTNLRGLVKLRKSFERDEQASLIFAVSSFDGDDSWISTGMKELADNILDSFEEPDVPLLDQILSVHLKPIFLANPHPSINAATGRKLPRPLGGPLGQHDFFEGQVWKSNPGLHNAISWCVRHIKTQAYQKLWHLVIPPVMTLLDDYEVRVKLRGVKIVSELLQAVPSELLQRTGVGELLYTSLKSCFNFLHNPETPTLFRVSVPAIVSLITMTTDPGTSQRFEKLCSILGDGIIGSVWLYGSREPETIEATLEVLPSLIDALGIASARFLKGLIPQLTHPLISDTENMPPIKFQVKSLRALNSVIDKCAPRMQKWKGTVIDGVGRRWVTLVDSAADDTDTRELKRELIDTLKRLATACPSIVNEEYQVLLRTDPDMFRPLLDTRAPEFH